jgi:hypothetical protein
MNKALSVIVICGLVMLSAGESAAQQAFQPTLASGLVWSPAASQPDATTAMSTGILGDGSKDYRYTGMWVGVGTALALSYVGYELCHNDDGGCDASAGRVVLGTLLATAVTGTIGALIGAQFDRAPDSAASP